MKPKEKKPETVFRIISRMTGEAVGCYSRACCDEYDFLSVEQARNANWHGTFHDKKKYKIARYKVTYELIEDDCEVTPAQVWRTPIDESTCDACRALDGMSIQINAPLQPPHPACENPDGCRCYLEERK